MILHRKRTIAAVVSGALFVLACEESPLAPVVPEGEGIVIYRDIIFRPRLLGS